VNRPLAPPFFARGNVGAHAKMKTDQTKYKLQSLNITADWTVRWNEFYDIDPTDNVPEDDKLFNIYYQEDLLLLQKGSYHLDLGWYGKDKLDNNLTGYCIHLFKGVGWLHSTLLIKFRTKDKKEIVKQINSLIKAVDNKEFDELKGHYVSEENTNRFSDFDEYDVRKK